MRGTHSPLYTWCHSGNQYINFSYHDTPEIQGHRGKNPLWMWKRANLTSLAYATYGEAWQTWKDFARSSGKTCISDHIFLLKTDLHRPVRNTAIIEFLKAKRHVLYELRWIFMKNTANKLSKDKIVLDFWSWPFRKERAELGLWSINAFQSSASKLEFFRVISSENP